MRSILTLLAIVAIGSTGFGQSVAKINQAVKTVQPANAQPEAPVSALSRGIIDAQGNVLANGKTGVLALTGTVTLSDPTTPSLTTAASKTNTGYLQVNGKTSGATKFTTADATAQTVTHTTAAQTTGAATVTIPDMAGVSATFSFNSTATLTAGATPAFAPGAAISTYLLTPGEDETIAATTTGATAGKVYFLRVLTSGTTSRTLTFGTNFKSTGTLATGTVSAKVFVIGFLFDGTSFVEVGRTTAM
jgi:hypothetical protein